MHRLRRSCCCQKLGVLDTSATGGVRKRGEPIRIPWKLVPVYLFVSSIAHHQPCTLFGRLRPRNSARAAGIAPNPNPTQESLLQKFHSCIPVFSIRSTPANVYEFQAASTHLLTPRGQQQYILYINIILIS